MTQQQDMGEETVLNAEPGSSQNPAVARVPVPDIDRVSVVFGDIKHLPKMADIPEKFCSWDGSGDAAPYCKFVSDWFFSGRKPEDMARLKERPGVDRNKALAAVKAILSSFEPKHEHKNAGAAYLLSEWFELS